VGREVLVAGTVEGGALDFLEEGFVTLVLLQALLHGALRYTHLYYAASVGVADDSAVLHELRRHVVAPDVVEDALRH
jgi:hypothetical protein